MAEAKEIPGSSDVLVIGGGLGGLVCALEMQKNGLQVVLVEKRHVAGGYAHLFSRGEYRFDASLHHIGGLENGGMTHKLLKSLDVLKLLEFEKPEILTISEFPDAVYKVPNNPELAAAYLGKLFPEDSEGLKELLSYSARLKSHVIGPVLYPDFNVPIKDMLSMQNVDATFEDLLERFVHNSRLKAVLAQLWMYLGLPPTRSSANFSNCVFASGFVEGRYHLKGGSKALVDALLSRFKDEGGTVVLGKKVSRIEVAGKAATGVVLNDGTVIKTNFIAANASPLDIFPGLVAKENLSPVFLHRLQNMEPSLSAFATYIGLDCPADNLGIPRGNTFINHGDDLEKAYSDCLEGRIDSTDWCLSNSEDSVLTSNGHSNIGIVEVTPAGDWIEMDKDAYHQKKAEVQQRLLAKYNARYPGLMDHAAVVEFGTPRTVRRFSGNAYGALYGFAQISSQANNRRLSNRTPIKGLYLCGAWTQAGGGYEGTMMTGMKSAHMILAENNKSWDTGLRFTEAPAEKEEKQVQDLSTPEYPFYSNTYPIYPDDTDWSGFAKETTFLRFMDRARVRLIHQSPELLAIRPLLESYYVKLYSISAHFHNRADVGEKATIQTGYKRATTHRAAVDHHISDSRGRTLVTGVAEIMFVTHQEQLVELPDIYRTQKTQPFEMPKALLPKTLFADLSNYRFESEFLVNYEDTDTQGVVYNVSYIKIAQKMFWEIHGDILPSGDDVSRIRAEHLEIRFMNAARLGEIIQVKAGFRPIDENRFGVDYRMILKETGATLTDIHMEYVQG